MNLSALKDRLKFGFGIFLYSTVIIFITFIIYTFWSGVYQDMDFLAWIYYIFTALGHASLFSTILYIIAYIPLALITRKKIIPSSLYIILATLMQIVLIIDMFVFDLYKFHINGFVIELLLGGGATDIFVFDWKLYLRFTAIALFFAIIPLILGYFISNKYYKKFKPSFIKRSCILLGFCIILSHVSYAAAHATRHLGIQKSATVLPLFFPLTINSLLTKWGILQVDEVDKVSYKKTSSDLQYPINPILVNDSIPNYNIIYIAIDSWNFSVLDTVASPNISAFLPKSQYFTKHLSSNYGTRGSIFGLFFGLSFTYENEFYISAMSPLLVDRLVDKGYDIETFPSANFTSPPFHEIIFRKVPGIRTRAKGNSPIERDEDITNEFINFIDKRNNDKPFFSFMFYDLPHAMIIPEEHRQKFQPSWEAPHYMELKNDMDRTPFFNLYKNCMHYTDELVGKVLAKIEEKGLLENSVIIITGDHGQEFNENKKNYWGHGSNFSKWQIQVPLIVYYPGIEKGKKHDHTTTHYDISPTVLSRFLGIKNPSSDYSMGYDLWDDTDRYPHVVGDHVNYGFVMRDVIVRTRHTGTMTITDLEMNEVPKSTLNVKELRQAIEKKNMFYKK